MVHFPVNRMVGRPKRAKSLDASDWRFLEALHRYGTANWSQLKKNEGFSQELIHAEEKRLQHGGFLSVHTQGRQKLFSITPAGEKKLSELHSPESRETAEFVISSGKTCVKTILDAYMRSLSNPEMIKVFYSSSTARQLVVDAFNLFRELHLRNGKPIHEGPVVAELRIKAEFSDVPPPAKVIRIWKNRPSFPPEEISKWIEPLYWTMTEATSIQQVLQKFERVAVRGRLSDQVIMLGFSKLRSLWETEIYDRAKLKKRLMMLRGDPPDSKEITAWFLFFDALNTMYPKLNRELVCGTSKPTFRIIEAYTEKKKEYPHATQDLKSLHMMLSDWRKTALQSIPTP